MKKIAPFVLLEMGVMVAAVLFMVLGNVLAIGGVEQGTGAATALTLGFAMSVFALLIALLVTATNRDDTEVGDITVVNIFVTPLIVGCLFTIGSFYDDAPHIQTLFLDTGLVMGSFFVFVLIWFKLKEAWDFFELEDIKSGEDKDKFPHFFLATLLLGIIYTIPIIIFKILYLIIFTVSGETETAYNWTCYPYIGFIWILSIAYVLGKEAIISGSKKIGSKVKSVAPKKVETPKPKPSS